MTREEKTICKIYLDDMDEHHTCNEYKLLMQLLEQEPCEDCIRRQAVLDLVVANHTELNGVNVVMYTPFYKDITQLPPVTPAEKVWKMREATQEEREGVEQYIDNIAETCSDAISRQAYDKGFDDGLEEGLKVGACDDCISRQEAIDAFNAFADSVNQDTDIHEAIEIVLNLPPVTPQQKIGHWITTRTFMHDGEYYCDRCKCDAPNNEKWDYCSNCGVKMEES